MIETAIRLENLIKSGQDLSPVCKGQFSMFILPTKLNYCTLSKCDTNIKCKHLYDYSYFKRACLYELDTKEIIRDKWNKIIQD